MIKPISLLMFCLMSWPTFAKEQTAQVTIAFTHENYNFFNLFEQFSAATGIQVKTAAFASEDLKVELLQRADNDLLPDAVIVPADYIGLEEINYSEIPPELNDPNTDSSLVSALKIDQKQFGIPIIAGNHLVLYYNKRYVSSPAVTWSSMFEMQNTLPKGVDLIGWSYNEMYWFLPFLTAFGEPPLQGHQMALDTQGMRSALKYYWQLSEQGYVDPHCDYQCSFDKFAAGQLAYMINGVWANGKLNQTMAENLGVAVLPQIGDKTMQPYYSAHVLAFPNRSLSSDKRQHLQRLAQFFQSYQTQAKIWYELHSLPVHRLVLNKVRLEAGQNERAIFEQLDRAVPMPTTREMAIVWEAIGKGANRYMAGVFSAEKATQYMQYVADKTVKEYQK